MIEVGIFCGFSAATPPEDVIAMAQAVEERGFHCLWVPEHVLFFEEYASRYPYSEDGRIHGFRNGMLDPFVALTFLAANTRTIRLGTSICLVPGQIEHLPPIGGFVFCPKRLHHAETFPRAFGAGLDP